VIRNSISHGIHVLPLRPHEKGTSDLPFLQVSRHRKTANLVPGDEKDAALLSAISAATRMTRR
jgi:hypothetical protein